MRTKAAVLAALLMFTILAGCDLARRISVIGEAIVTTSVLTSLCKTADRSDPEVAKACDVGGTSPVL